MSFWYDKKGKSYATKGNSSWVKAYAEHLVASSKDGLFARLDRHIAGTEGCHKAENVIYDDTTSVQEAIKANAENIHAQASYLETRFQEGDTSLRTQLHKETDALEKRIYEGDAAILARIQKEFVYVAAISKTTDKKKKFNFSDYDNYIIRMEEAEEITFVFGEALPETYYFELSFDSGAEPTSMIYHNSGQLTWLGDDCFTTQEGLSVFEPRPDTSYDIIFYCRKGHIIGKVCGYPIFPW